MPVVVDPQVIAVVRTWAKSANVDSAAIALRDGRRTLDPALLPVLIGEIAEITAELLIALFDLPPRSEPKADAKPVEVLGLPLHTHQIERFQAWVEDQKPTAAALGVDVELWMKRVTAGFEAVLQRARGESGTAPQTAGQKAAAALLASSVLGQDKATFEARPALGTSEKAGLRGMLGALSFKDPKKK
jgi:hypothetical protein